MGGRSVREWISDGRVAVLRAWAGWLSGHWHAGAVVDISSMGTLGHSAHAPRGAILHPTIVMAKMDGCTGNALTQALEDAGYTVRTTYGWQRTLQGVQAEHPPLVIVCGPAEPRLLQALHQSSPARILALLPTATGAELLAAFDAGVDDCQLATIGTDEVLMRVRALLRRAGE